MSNYRSLLKCLGIFMAFAIYLSIKSISYIEYGCGIVEMQAEKDKDLPSHIIPAKWTTNKGTELSNEIIAKYLRLRSEGLSQEKITSNDFGEYLPNSDSKRPHSFPFVSRDTFRSAADFVYERITKVEMLWTRVYRDVWMRRPKRTLFDGAILYVRAGHLEKWAVEVLPKINTSFVLITHGGDENMPAGIDGFLLLDHPLLLHWFTVNPARSHPKLSGLPIGLPDGQLLSGRPVKGSNLTVFEELIRRAPNFYDGKKFIERRYKEDPRPNLVFINFKTERHPARRKAEESFANLGTFRQYNATNRDAFWDDLTKSKFTLSPPGFGEDCYRTWEALLLGSIPVVRPSPLVKALFAPAEMPIIVLTNWEKPSEVLFINYSPETTSRRSLMAPFWFDVIRATRDREIDARKQKNLA